MRKIKVVVLLGQQLQHGFTKNAKVSPNLTVAHLIMAAKQHLFFQKKKWNLIYINSQLNLINNLFCYLSRLSSRFTPKYRPTLRLYRPMFYNFYVGDKMITKFIIL